MNTSFKMSLIVATISACATSSLGGMDRRTRFQQEPHTSFNQPQKTNPLYQQRGQIFHEENVTRLHQYRATCNDLIHRAQGLSLQVAYWQIAHPNLPQNQTTPLTQKLAQQLHYLTSQQQRFTDFKFLAPGQANKEDSNFTQAKVVLHEAEQTLNNLQKQAREDAILQEQAQRAHSLEIALQKQIREWNPEKDLTLAEYNQRKQWDPSKDLTLEEWQQQVYGQHRQIHAS